MRYFLSCLLTVLLSMGYLPRAVAASAKPVLMMGGSYSHYERETLRRDILEPNEITFEDGGDFTSAELWKNYSMVIITHKLPALNEREIGWIQDYVKDGGRILLTGPILASLKPLKKADRDWLGAEGYRVVRDGEFAVTKEGQSLVPDAAAANAIFGRAADYGPTKLTTAVSLVSRGGVPIVFRNTFGKGEVWYAGLEYFRILNTEKIAARKITVGKPAREFLEKLILQGDVQKKSQRIAAGFKAYGSADPVVWRRDFVEARGASYADPPYPRPGEALKTIQLDLGIDEWESTPFYLTNARADKNFSIIVSDLTLQGTPEKGNGKTTIPASAIRLRVQGVAAPQLTVGPYWLLDVPRRDTMGQSTFAVPLKADDSNTIWLTFNTHDLLPGTYHGAVHFSDTAMAPLELQIRVWPVRLPGREYFQTEATYNWSSLLPAGNKFSNPIGDLTHFEKHVADLAAHHIDFNEDGSWLNNYGRSISFKNVRLRDSGIPLDVAVKKGLIKESALPDLDFSYFDPLVEKPLLAGMAYFHFNFKNAPKDWSGYARDITGDKDLPFDSPRHIAIKRWLLGQCMGYLRSKGITHIVSFIADEIAPDEIPDVLRRAKLMHEAGIRVEFTATGRVGQSREHIAALNPAIDRWIWNAVILPQAKAILKENSPIDPTDKQFTYVADWHRAPYVFNRTRGAFCAYHQLDGLFIHGYLRWYPNGGAVFNTAAGPVDTEGWEGARDGIEDARYWKRAQALLKIAATHPDLASRVSQIKRQMAQWVAPDANALVQLKDASYYIYRYQSPQSTYDRLQTLKRQLLESLVWLQANVKTASTLQYAGLKLIDADRPRVQFLGNPAALAALNAVLADRGLPILPEKSPTDADVKLAVGTRAQLAPLLDKAMIEKMNPSKGSYCVAVEKNTIIVVGADDAGTLIGAKIMGQLIENAVP